MRYLLLGLLLGCRVGGTNALPPAGGDGGVAADGAADAAGDDPAPRPDAGRPPGARPDAGGGGAGDAPGRPDAASPADGAAGGPDAPAADGGCADTDGDGQTDCDEIADGDEWTDPGVFNGLRATIGDRPEWTGGCGNLDDFAEMESRFDGSDRVQDVWAGWEFDTDADAYSDPSYGFQPPWPPAGGGRFSVRYSGRMRLRQGGQHCFRVNIGATGTDIVGGRNACGQIYLDATPSSEAFVETGFEARSATALEECVQLEAGVARIDIVFWYFNVVERAHLTVSHCYGGDARCPPLGGIAPRELQVPAP